MKTGKHHRRKMKHTDFSLHHRKPRSLGGSDDKDNKINVVDSQHRAWHTLFSNYTPEVIASIINQTWLDPEYKFVVTKK